MANIIEFPSKPDDSLSETHRRLAKAFAADSNGAAGFALHWHSCACGWEFPCAQYLPRRGKAACEPRICPACEATINGEARDDVEFF